LSGSSPLTCLAWEALPVAYATASIALGIMWPHKPHHYVKLGIPSGGRLLKFTLLKFIYIVIHLVWSSEKKEKLFPCPSDMIKRYVASYSLTRH
jgi:hypothetical protein